MAEIEAELAEARRVVERAEFRDAVARLNRMLDKFFRRAEGIGLHPGSLRSRVGNWLERETRRVLEQAE